MKYLACSCLLACAVAAHAGEARSDAPLRDPWVPPAVREQARPAPETRGSALHAQVEAKLRKRFDAADTQGQGSITHEQARAAHLGFIAGHFDDIDEAHTGRITFEDVKRFLRARGARTL
ncbi:MAG TPA: EF-hand domain-containing protein [Ramlibacter sp.]|jgi:hypothetical protein